MQHIHATMKHRATPLDFLAAWTQGSFRRTKTVRSRVEKDGDAWWAESSSVAACMD
tara:strand:+ start:39 stop:206 length:168 start_codon:yes stop_codon:yes gene_type:complete